MSGYEVRLNELTGNPVFSAVLESAGGPAYLVGGCVRDILLGRDVRDYDVVVQSDLQAAAEKAAQSLGVRAAPIGREPLTVYRLSAGETHVDLCPLEGADLTADLKRRDLTVNAMAVKLRGAGRFELLDPCGGLKDLENRVVRFVSEANVLADPLRLLRLFRFSAVLDFAPDPESLDLVGKHASLIRRSAGERVRAELLELLGVPRCGPVVRAMLDTGLLESIVPEIVPLRGCTQGGRHHLDVMEHTLAALEAAEDVIASPEDFLPSHAENVSAWLAEGDRPALVKLAVLLHDLGKPETRTLDENGAVRFLGHDGLGVEKAGQIADRLRLSTEENRLIVHLIRHHLRPFHLMDAHAAGRLTGKGIYRFGRDLGGDLWGVVVHALADVSATRGPIQEEKGGPAAFIGCLDHLLAALAAQRKNVEKTPLPIGGRDLIETFGLEPSPLIGRLLDAVREAHALGRIAGRSDALALAGKRLKILGERGGSPTGS